MAAGKTPIATFTKDPDSILTYTLNWNGSTPGPWLDTGDTISTSTWIVPNGISASTSSNTNTTTTVKVGAATSGEDYSLTNRITTANGLKTDRTILIRVRER